MYTNMYTLLKTKNKSLFIYFFSRTYIHVNHVWDILQQRCHH